jgi:hypothetical protein
MSRTQAAVADRLRMAIVCGGALALILADARLLF